MSRTTKIERELERLKYNMFGEKKSKQNEGEAFFHYPYIYSYSYQHSFEQQIQDIRKDIDLLLKYLKVEVCREVKDEVKLRPVKKSKR